MIIKETDRLLIRTWNEEDILAIESIYKDKENMKLVIGGTMDYDGTRAAVKRWEELWEKNGFGVWPVFFKENGKLIGHAGLDNFPEKDEIYINILIDKKYRGKELGEEAVKAVMTFAFNEAGLEKIAAIAKPANVHFTRILEELNMKHKHEGMYQDEYITYYEISKDEVKWEKIFKYLK